MKASACVTALLGCCAAASVPAQNFLDDDSYAQFWVGTQSVDRAWSLTDTEGADYLADLDKVRRLGFSFQAPARRGAVEYGWELNGSLGYDGSSKVFFRVGDSGTDVAFRLDSQLWLMDVGLGGFVSARPVSWLRAYASAGPVFYWGHLRHDDDASTADDRWVIDTRTSDNHVGVGLYGRLGLEVIFSRAFTLGLSAGYSNSRYDFDRSGTLDLAEPRYFLTIGRSL